MATATATTRSRLEEILGADAKPLLDHECKTVLKSQLHLPGPTFVDQVWTLSDRPTRVLRSIQSLFDNGRLAGTGYLSILPVDQGRHHLLRLGRVRPPDPGDRGCLPGGPRAGHGDRALVLPAQLRLRQGRRRLPPGR